MANKLLPSMIDGGFYPGHINGLTLSNNVIDAANDIDIAAGSATDGAGSALMTLATAMTKRLDAAWAVGDGSGGRMSAAAIADTTYHVFLISRSDTGVVDVGFDVSPTSPTMPTSYDSFRRIGSIMRASGAIRGFSQVGDEFLWSAGAIADVAGGALTTSASLTALTVPSGIKVSAIVSAAITHGSLTNRLAIFSSPDAADIAPGNTGQASVSVVGVLSPTGEMRIRTDTSGQIRGRGDTTLGLYVSTHGWVDTRGR